MPKTYAGDVTIGTVLTHEGEAGTVIDIDAAAVDTRMGATYSYTFTVEFSDGTQDEFTLWEGDEITVA